MSTVGPMTFDEATLLPHPAKHSTKMEGYIAKANQILNLPLRSHKTQPVFTRLLKDCKGLAILSIHQAGAGVTMIHGTGVVMAKTARGGWSAPSAALVSGFGMGAVAGAKVDSTIVFIMNDQALEGFASRPQSRIGLDAAVAMGKLGGDKSIGLDEGTVSMTYSKGAFAGMGLVMGTLVIQEKENQLFYGKKVSAKDILLGGQGVNTLHDSQISSVYNQLGNLARGVCWLPAREDLESWSNLIGQAEAWQEVCAGCQREMI